MKLLDVADIIKIKKMPDSQISFQKPARYISWSVDLYGFNSLVSVTRRMLRRFIATMKYGLSTESCTTRLKGGRNNCLIVQTISVLLKRSFTVDVKETSLSKKVFISTIFRRRLCLYRESLTQLQII